MACGVFAYLRGSGSWCRRHPPKRRPSSRPKLLGCPHAGVAPGHTAGTTNTINQVGECGPYETLRLHPMPEAHTQRRTLLQ